MNALDRIVARAASRGKRIVLAEGEDPRVQEGACRAAAEGVADVILVGDTARIRNAVGDGIAIADPSIAAEAYADAFFDLRKHKGIERNAALQAVRNPLVLAAMMVREGHADGSVGGAVATTADTVRAALQTIGPAPGVKTVSSFFLIGMNLDHHERREAVIFADCGMVVEPSTDQLADIACASADSYRALIGGEPNVAMLSFSSKGSASHPTIDRIAEALQKARTRRPDLNIDGELQFDAAFVPSVAASKAPGSPVAGAANVLVFPNLEAANIGYKIAQRIGGAQAVGPILQGLAKPANDLSRGCNADDVFLAIAVTALQA